MAANDVKILLQEPNPLLSSLSKQFNDSAHHIGILHYYMSIPTIIMLFALGVGPVILNYYPSNNQSDQTKEETP